MIFDGEQLTEKKSKRRLTPTLRFPEFREESGWEERTGDSLFDQINERNPDPGLPVLAITQEHGAIPRDMINYHVSVTGKSIKSYKVVQVGDFIISLRSFQGGIEHSQYHGICSPAYVILRRRTGGSDAYFKHYLKTDRFIRVLTRNLEGLRDGKMISYKQFSELLLPVPSPPEQQKIAECLSSLDDLIAAEGRMLEALKAHKKGLMQQLFPQPGQTQPCLRFPEFRDKEEWEAHPLDSVSQFAKKKIPLHQLNLDTYVSTENLSPDYGGIKKASKLPPNGSATEYKPDDILIANIRPYLKKVWRSNRSGGASNDVIVIRAKAVLRKDYLSMVIANDAFINYVMKTAKGVKMPRGDITSMKEYIVPYPTHAEQQKIADCLTSLDTRIAAQAAKIETLNQHKRGLMQQLFPAPEATGL